MVYFSVFTTRTVNVGAQIICSEPAFFLKWTQIQRKGAKKTWRKTMEILFVLFGQRLWSSSRIQSSWEMVLLLKTRDYCQLSWLSRDKRHVTFNVLAAIDLYCNVKGKYILKLVKIKLSARGKQGNKSVLPLGECNACRLGFKPADLLERISVCFPYKEGFRQWYRFCRHIKPTGTRITATRNTSVSAFST